MPPRQGSDAALCIFEFIYFARPDSRMDGMGLHARARYRMGERLACEAPADADIVISVPDSGTPAAQGYARPQRPARSPTAWSRTATCGRTFIQPDQGLREHGLRLKFNPVPDLIAGQRVVVVDDSIVRGSTTRKIVQMLRAAGAAEVHLRISSPPIVSPCYYGIDMAGARRADRGRPQRSRTCASRSAPTRSPTSRWTACSERHGPRRRPLLPRLPDRRVPDARCPTSARRTRRASSALACRSARRD